MKTRINHYNYIVRITYTNYNEGNPRQKYFTTKRDAERFAKMIQSGAEDFCKVEIIKEKGTR